MHVEPAKSGRKCNRINDLANFSTFFAVFPQFAWLPDFPIECRNRSTATRYGNTPQRRYSIRM